MEKTGKYHYILKTAKTNVQVGAYTKDKEPIKAYVNIENTSYALYEISKQVDITAKQTEVAIRVKAEDGSIKEHTLIIEGLPDDTTIKEVVVNGEKATYIEGKRRYEIRSQADTFDIDVTLNDLLASMELGGNPKAIGRDSITVTKEGPETIVKVKVTSQNELETEEYTIVIMEKSSNCNLDTIEVNGKKAVLDIDGKYKVGLKNNTSLLDITATAEDKYAITQIGEAANNTYIAKLKETVVDRKNNI